MRRYKTKSYKSWVEEDIPSSKMLLKGKRALSDSEILSVIIGQGVRDKNPLDLAKTLLSKYEWKLNLMARASASDLANIEGIGLGIATRILCALELGCRKDQEEVLLRERITCSRDAFNIFKGVMGDQPYEEFWILILNKANRIMHRCCISEGGISGTVVDPKKIFKIALDNHASSIILGHNHPSGNVRPSEADITITKKIRDAGIMLDMAVLDHIIVGEDSYFSFADEGII